VSGFLEKALNQDIELRLRLAEYFKHLAQGDDDFKHGWEQYNNALEMKRTRIQKEIDDKEQELAELQKRPPQQRDIIKEDRLREQLNWRRNEVGYVALGRTVAQETRSVTQPTQIAAERAATYISVDVSIIPPAKRPVAQMIVTAFGDAGFGPPQQAAAVAAAFFESQLDPQAKTADGSVGLFGHTGPQKRGLTDEQIMDPETSIRLIIGEARQSVRFRTATNVYDAVSAFVTQITRPAMSSEAIRRQVAIATQLVPP
jgi:hypothetical protein